MEPIHQLEHVIIPDWSAPCSIAALTTTRNGGISRGAWASLNLADHVGDEPEHVMANRALLCDALGLVTQPCWLNQVHGTSVVNVVEAPQPWVADAAYANRPGVACAVLTADCLPVLMTNTAGTEVAAVHAGWRGLVNGVIEAAVARFSAPRSQLIAWLGPALGPTAFEVGPEVREAFLASARDHRDAFVASAGDRYLADLALLGRQRLARAGVSSVTCSTHCTYSEAELFYSYRRDHSCGRMASMIWISEDPVAAATR